MEGFLTMTTRARMTYAVSAATVVTLALAGCNGGAEDPSATATTTTSSQTPSVSASSASPSATATPSPSATASITIPAAARANTDAGAIAFVRFWFEQVNLAYTKPDAALIPALSTESCKSCADIAGEPREYAAKGHRMSAIPIQPLTNARLLPGSPNGKRRVSFVMTQNAVDIVNGNGVVVDTQAAAKGTRLALVAWKEGQWYMDGLAAPA